jgi:hypothetical protein
MKLYSEAVIGCQLSAVSYRQQGKGMAARKEHSLNAVHICSIADS